MISVRETETETNYNMLWSVLCVLGEPLGGHVNYMGVGVGHSRRAARKRGSFTGESTDE